MNKICFGLTFVLLGKKYYRCLSDGTIYKAEKNNDYDSGICPHCGRTIESENAKVYALKKVIEFRLQTETGSMGPFRMDI